MFSSLAIRFVNNKITTSKDIDGALINVIDITYRFKKKIRTDIHAMNSSDLSTNERTKDIVNYGHLQIENIQQFKRAGLKIRDPKVMLKLILLKMKHSKTSNVVLEDQSK